ncbi:GFA family protein [Aureimonas sp. AU12]|uniref:GFA family protein n=1 Tax=Aureimonas sp. AU12 TaxID=1638161 RepID=UPI0007832926|nr:GFA family protein [Aureimonas sp. AU12]
MTGSTIEGRCRCERTRFRVSGAPLMTMACHCTGCRKMTASAFSLSSLFASEAFAVTEGEPAIGGLHGATRHFFCPHCMSWLFTRPEGLDDFVMVRAAMLDDAGTYRPFAETFTSEKLPWVSTPAVHSFERFPAPEAFPALLEDYARRAGP